MTNVRVLPDPDRLIGMLSMLHVFESDDPNFDSVHGLSTVLGEPIVHILKKDWSATFCGLLTEVDDVCLWYKRIEDVECERCLDRWHAFHDGKIGLGDMACGRHPVFLPDGCYLHPSCFSCPAEDCEIPEYQAVRGKRN